MHGSIFAHQFPPVCQSITLLNDDLHGAGLGMTAKMMVFALITANKHGRTLMESESLRRWCTKPPGTLQCYYRPWTNCTLSGVQDVKNVSLQTFWRSGKWYGMSKSTASLQARAFNILFQPRKIVTDFVQRLIVQCGGTDFWTVHYRDSPEKKKERGRLPAFDKYIQKIPTNATRILWQTSNPQGFLKMIEYSKKSDRKYCHTNFTRHINDVWGGRKPNVSDESGITGAVNGEAARRGIGSISYRSSKWNWFMTIGTNQTVILIWITLMWLYEWQNLPNLVALFFCRRAGKEGGSGYALFFCRHARKEGESDNAIFQNQIRSINQYDAIH